MSENRLFARINNLNLYSDELRRDNWKLQSDIGQLKENIEQLERQIESREETIVREIKERVIVLSNDPHNDFANGVIYGLRLAIERTR